MFELGAYKLNPAHIIKMFVEPAGQTKIVISNGGIKTPFNLFDVEHLITGGDEEKTPFIPLTVSSSKETELIHRDHITALLPNERGGAKVLLSDGSHIWTLEDHDEILDMLEPVQ
jgi:hypothetical protein